MRNLASLVGLVAASALVSTACVEKIDTDPPGTGAGGPGGSGGGGGGGETTGVDVLYGSGSRLQAVYRDGGNGARQLVSFYDSELDQDCGFAEAADGEVRCLPTQTVTVRYTDAGCNDPVVVVTACDTELPAQVSVAPTSICPSSHLSRRDAYTVGSASTATALYVDDGAGCVADVSFDALVDVAYEIAPADEAIFARGTVVDHPADGGIGQRVATTEDGAFQVLGAYNIAREEACGAMTLGDDTLCLSANLGYGTSNSSSASCTEQDVAYVTSPSECGEPQAVIKYTDATEQCEPPTQTLHALGDAIDAGDVYTDEGGTCMATTQTDYRFYEIGNEAGKGVVPTLTAATAGDGRLTLQLLTSAEGKPMGYAALSFMDTERDEVCGLASTTDGDKCLPAMPTVADTGTGFFSDDQCTVPVLNVSASVCAGEVPTMFATLAAPEVSTCAATQLASIHAVGAEHTGPVYQDALGTCTLGTYEGIDFYEVGAAVAFTEFADLQRVTETD